MPAQTCKRLIPAIAREVGVPTSLLMAIASVESRFEAYAVNHAGTSLSFESPGEALSYVEEQLSQGEDNMDIGCMQVNWQCHKDNLQSLGKDSRDLLIPSTNIRYAARFLKTLYAELGTWAKAVAAYHSRHSHSGTQYLIRVANAIKEARTESLLTTTRLNITGQTLWKRQDRDDNAFSGFYCSELKLLT